VPGSSANGTRASISGSSDQLNGDDVRHDPLEVRKATLANVLARAGNGIRLNDQQTVFRHACKLGLEGIVSKRRDSPYRSGRSPIGSR
jgi:bifunctional non-homologous end joining protein LigD